MATVIDWNLAASVGVQLASSGPVVTPRQARDVVSELREAAAAAVAPVAGATGLACPPDTADTLVVDRSEWIRSNVRGLESAVGPTLDRLASQGGRSSRAVASIGARATGVQLGAALAYMSGKVLGQFEAFRPPGTAPRLLLVAPNILLVERSLGVDPADFRLWVALHEETHRVQFGAVPWLAHHLLGEVTALLDLAEVRGDDVLARLVAGARSVGAGGSLVEVLQSPEQREVLNRLTAVMSLLEGHADHVMDVAAPALIPSLNDIRERFDHRRNSPNVIEGLVRRLLGLDAKLRQYSDGAAFVRATVAEAGMSGFNEVWRSPESLPTLAEIHDPSVWLRRTAEQRSFA